MAEAGRTCQSCPSFRKAEEGPKYLKKNIGAPFCARYSTPLGRAGLKPMQEQKLGTLIASKCDAYGEPAPAAPIDTRLDVVIPKAEPRLRAYNGEIDPEKQDLVKTCITCVNFVRDDIVASELGWGIGLCAAKGRLILPARQVSEARNCEFREYGSGPSSTGGMMLSPEYEEAFNFGSVDPVKAFFNKTFIDPVEYVTDRPVSEEESAQGIRAFRKIYDPTGLTENFVFLPIYKMPEDEDEASRIPRTGDEEHPEDYVDHLGLVYKVAVLWTQLDETPALWGVAGTGKTEFYRHMAWLMCLPFERISITASTEIEDLAGKMHFSQEKGTYYEYGRMPKAWVRPNVICLDEPNVGPPDVWQFIRPLTDNSKQLVLDMNAGERLPRHDDCYLGMAMNPAWDVRNVGAEVISDADGSRLMHVMMEMPPAILEREMLKKRCEHDGWQISDSQLNMVMGIAEEVRALCDQGTLPITWGIRPQIKVARALRWFDIVTAYRMATADYLEPEAQAALLDVVRAHSDRVF